MDTLRGRNNKFLSSTAQNNPPLKRSGINNPLTIKYILVLNIFSSFYKGALAGEEHLPGQNILLPGLLH